MSSTNDNLLRPAFRWPLLLGVSGSFLSASWLLAATTPRLLIVGPKEVPQQMLLLDSFGSSILRVLAGGGLAFGLALAVALLLSQSSRLVKKSGMWSALLIALTPPPIWSTVSILLLGLGNLAAIATIIFSTIFILTAVNCWLLLQIPTRRFHIADTYDAGFISVVRYIVLPEIRAGLSLGLRIDLIVAWIAVVVAESAGASSGLGSLVLFGRQLFDWHIVIAAWFAILGAAILTDAIAVFATSRYSSEAAR